MRAVIAGLYMLGLCGCQTSAPYAGPVAAKATTASEWHPGEQIKTFNSPTYGNISYRAGTTPSGLNYKIYGDGEATINSDISNITPDWKIICKTDAMNDKLDCDITSGRTPLFIDYSYSINPQTVCIYGHDYPGRVALIRVDKSPPISSGENGCVTAAAIMPALLRSKTISTRKVHWPYDNTVDETGPLLGLREATELLLYVRLEAEQPQ